MTVHDSVFCFAITQRSCWVTDFVRVVRAGTPLSRAEHTRVIVLLPSDHAETDGRELDLPDAEAAVETADRVKTGGVLTSADAGGSTGGSARTCTPRAST
jgi:hypothetical protein